GRLSVMVILPSPTSLLPAQLIAAPFPAGGPSKEFFAFESSFIHGDQASHFFSSFTCGKMATAGARIVAERETWKSPGCKATMTRNTTIIAAMERRMIFNLGFLDMSFRWLIVIWRIR